jgi:uncharacterized protein
MIPDSIAAWAPAGTLLGALVAGLATSPHCIVMCGPLSCAAVRPGTGQVRGFLAYHAARMFVYALVGGIAGGLGATALRLSGAPELQLLPWFLPVFFLALAFRIEQHIARVPGVNRLAAAAGRLARRVPARLAPGALGLATPLLPCAPLYLFFALTLAVGNAAWGAALGAGFALGTIPLLLLAQFGIGRWRQHLKPVTLQRFQSGLAGTAAVLATIRLLMVDVPLLCH